ncbi:HAD family hydrolase [Caldisalinibacter kiritimatiensis]|uniref:HAD family hydrolase, a n=1 Tax=Caldisalinibacter kiritimatiensis TaxID=1304284 RepID=R1CGY2_9FIRM|nr:HAD hydrolase family protein [Caldisalinibacter kiritimatiensis]EOD01560.1 hypothetical protein L21TH_0363 [Caldisalinibacter kiritimatiensis]
MIKIDIPSYKDISIKYLVFDYNGTLAADGKIDNGIKNKLNKLSEIIEIFVLTADTFGTVREYLKDTNVKLHIISKENGTQDKVDFIKNLGLENCVAVGNGNNDSLMLKEAGLGICILGKEGCATNTLLNSDLVIKSIEDCIELFFNTDRLKASLRG